MKNEKKNTKLRKMNKKFFEFLFEKFPIFISYILKKKHFKKLYLFIAFKNYFFRSHNFSHSKNIQS